MNPLRFFFFRNVARVGLYYSLTVLLGIIPAGAARASGAGDRYVDHTIAILAGVHQFYVSVRAAN